MRLDSDISKIFNQSDGSLSSYNLLSHAGCKKTDIILKKNNATFEKRR